MLITGEKSIWVFHVTLHSSKTKLVNVPSSLESWLLCILLFQYEQPIWEQQRNTTLLLLFFCFVFLLGMQVCHMLQKSASWVKIKCSDYYDLNDFLLCCCFKYAILPSNYSEIMFIEKRCSLK